jgi:CheY-like chemotaxis protein
LLVDDNEDARDVFCTWLTMVGFRCSEATDGADGLLKARTQQPAVVVMDASMAGMDGWDATRLLKADLTTKEIPVVMVSGHTFAEHRERAQQVGADLFLAKPLRPSDLEAAIRELIASTLRRARK